MGEGRQRQRQRSNSSPKSGPQLGEGTGLPDVWDPTGSQCISGDQPPQSQSLAPGTSAGAAPKTPSARCPEATEAARDSHCHRVCCAGLQTVRVAGATEHQAPGGTESPRISCWGWGSGGNERLTGADPAPDSSGRGLEFHPAGDLEASIALSAVEIRRWKARDQPRPRPGEVETGLCGAWSFPCGPAGTAFPGVGAGGVLPANH